MLNIYKTNRIELITEVLAKELLINPPLVTEKLNIPINDYLLAKWMRDQITLKNEISALYEFQTLTTYTEEIIRNLSKNKKLKSWNFESIKWGIIESLEELGEFNESWPLTNWINKFIKNEKVLNREIYSLSEKIAKVFSDYILYRPEILEKWDKTDLSSSKLFTGLNEDKYWQPILFKLIEKNKLNKPICIYMLEIIKNIYTYKDDIENFLPKDIYIIVTDTLSKLQFKFYSKLSEFTNVKIYLLSPGNDIWNRINIKEGPITLDKVYTKQNLYPENIEGIFGKSLANFEKLIEEIIFNDELEVNIKSPYIDPSINKRFDKSPSLLSQIQKKIVDNNHDKFKINKADESFILRRCENLLKELEHIKNTILKICSVDNGINYKDIVIASTQYKSIKPYLKYIFNSDVKIPYFLSIENYKEISPIYNFIKLVIELANDKITQNEINIILSDPIAQKIFNFNDEEKDEIISLIINAGFHWGINSKERLGEFKNSLEWCIKRFTLGLIYADDFYNMEYDIKPFSNKNSSIDLNKWILILNEIINIIETFRGSYTFKNWLINFKKIFLNFNIYNDSLNEEINKFNKNLKELSKTIDSDIVIDLNLINELLTIYLNTQKSNLDQRGNEILISDIESARLIPHKITFVMGMNQLFYPRKAIKDNINLLSSESKFGDPSFLDKEKYIFLELLISCREQFIITWSNQDMENNLLEISSPIRQLIEILKSNISSKYQDQLIKNLDTINHNKNKLCIKSLNNSKEGLINSLEFKDKESNLKIYKLLELINWFKSPQLHWLKKRNIYPKKTFNYIPNDEGINNYEKFKLLNNIIDICNIDEERFKEKLSELNIKEQLILNGIISPKNSIFINEIEVNELIQSLILQFNNIENVERTYLKEYSNKVEYFKSDNQIIELIHSNTNFAKRSEVWIKLLFIASLKKDINTARIIYRKNNIYKSEIINIATPIKANKLMSEYIRIYKNSLKNCLPLPPESSYKYVKALMKNKDEKKAFIDEWVGNESFNFGERDKPEMQICYGYEKDPNFFLNNNNFKKLSLSLYKPFLDALLK